MELINGKKIAGRILEKVKDEVGKLAFKPLIIDVLAGDDPVSVSYVKIKGRTAQNVGMDFDLVQLPENIAQEDLARHISMINSYSRLCGLIIQLPLPKHLAKEEALNCIDPKVDIDCIGRACTANFYSGQAKILPPTAAAIMHMVEYLSLDLSGKKILVVGQGSLVGKPVSFLLKHKGYDVRIADSHTVDLKSLSLDADVIITGAGSPGLVTGKMVKRGAVIIDAGTSEAEGSIVGDADLESLKNVDCLVSPVPGGVGPVTVAMLLNNALSVARSIK